MRSYWRIEAIFTDWRSEPVAASSQPEYSDPEAEGIVRVTTRTIRR